MHPHDLSKYTDISPEMSALVRPPKRVPGRTVHIDGDFLAYQTSADTLKTFVQMQDNCSIIIEKLRLMAGADYAKLYLTPQGSDKGGRYGLAMLKPYQKSRQTYADGREKEKPLMLEEMRNWMAKEFGAVMCTEYEADDGMAMAQYNAADPNLSVICSKDKDLGMVPGLQMDWDTKTLTDTGDNPFGYIELTQKKSGKKLTGRGWKFFWAQMLMGDPADGISGLPLIVPAKGTVGGRTGLCGPVSAYNLLCDVSTNLEALELVKGLYENYGEQVGFRNYRDNSPITTTEAFVSEAQLLWMRRQADFNDVLFWLMEQMNA